MDDIFLSSGCGVLRTWRGRQQQDNLFASHRKNSTATAGLSFLPFFPLFFSCFLFKARRGRLFESKQLKKGPPFFAPQPTTIIGTVENLKKKRKQNELI